MFLDPSALHSSIQHAILMAVVVSFAIVMLQLIMSGTFAGITGSWQLGRMIANVVLITLIITGGAYSYENYRAIPIISDVVLNITTMTDMITYNLNQVTTVLN